MKKSLIINIKENRFVYQSYKCLISFLTRLKNNYSKHVVLNESLKIEAFNNLKSTDFFGYYNLSPWQVNSNRAIFLRHTSKKKTPSLNLPVEVVYKDNIELKVLDVNYAWNWQQGCMLQWFDSENIIYNHCATPRGKVNTRIFNVGLNKLEAEIEWPYYTLSHNRQFALSLNFMRLNQLRPEYGYSCMHYKANISRHNSDGVFYMDLKNVSAKLLVTLDEIVAFNHTDDMNNAIHKINHLDINPDDSKVMFLHRWFVNGVKRTRLLVYDLFTNKLTYIHGDEMVSHCCWLNNDTILGFCKFSGVGNRYAIFDLKNQKKEILNNLPHIDGHPSKSPMSDWIVTDTYPNKMRMSKLIIYNYKTDKLITIGEFYQPCAFVKEQRIDLHPKWSPDGKVLAFESGHSGKRKLYSINISDFLNE